MPKKKGQKKNIPKDFTINDSANAPKPVGRVKKSVAVEAPDTMWDQVQDDDFDIVEEIGADGSKSFVYKKKRNNSKTEVHIDDRQGFVYPEFIWYQISKYIKPEDIGYFARINKTTYAITKQKNFWRLIYKRHCEYNSKLPDRLRIENSFKHYGLRQRVIRALYHTYDVFIEVAQQALHKSSPYGLVEMRCVNVWFRKGSSHWSIFFKFKKLKLSQCHGRVDLIEELGRIDANPEEDSQVLQVTCQNFYEVPPVMGMILSSVRVVLSQGFRHQRLHLGFNSGRYVTKNILPECTVVIDTVIKIIVLDWWHPKYPHFENKLPLNFTGEESMPVLKKNFFDTHNERS